MRIIIDEIYNFAEYFVFFINTRFGKHWTARFVVVTITWLGKKI